MLLQCKENLACDMSSDAAEALVALTWNPESEILSDIRNNIGDTT